MIKILSDLLGIDVINKKHDALVDYHDVELTVIPEQYKYFGKNSDDRKELEIKGIKTV